MVALLITTLKHSGARRNESLVELAATVQGSKFKVQGRNSGNNVELLNLEL
jgi:hypothetical protein